MEHGAVQDREPFPGSPNQFTGEVSLRRLQSAVDGVGASVIEVTFAPAARTYWHSHPNGQLLLVTNGTAIVANEAGERVVAGPGEYIDCPSDEVHWHGATPDGPMTHLSVTTGGPPSWGQEVTEARVRGVDAPADAGPGDISPWLQKWT